MKILTVHFAEDRKSWKLVASKARCALKSMLDFSSDIEKALAELNVTFEF